ncbi:MAG TPA: hypothetical protein VEA61_08070 [Allosphingosinicella sp.]|nr:hypothetical protein [Allosphingosinicella sp.]
MFKRLLRWALALTGLCLATGAAAQTSVYDLPEKLVDGNGVDMAAGRLIISFPILNFGDQVRLKADYFARYPEAGSTVPHAPSAFDFYSHYSTGTGAEEIETGWSPLGSYAFYRLATWETVMPDGRAYSKPAGGRFLTQLQSASWQTPGHRPIGMVDEEGNFWEYGAWVGDVLVEQVLFANGEIWTIKRQKSPHGARLRHVVSTRGYMIQYEYEREAAPTVQAENAAWQRIVKISGGSLAHVYCDTSGVAVCPGISAAGNSATISYFANGYEMTHASGFKKRIEAPGNYQLLVSSPGTNEQVGAGFGYTDCDPTGTISSVTRNGQSWTYAWQQCTEEERGISWMMTRTDPQGRTIQVRQLSSYSIPDLYIDELQRQYAIAGSPTVGYAAFGYPEGNEVGKSFSSRNVHAGGYLYGKNGGTLSTGATFDPVCSNLKTCNRPNTTRDAKGNTTTYTYDPAHGGVLTMTGPAVDGVSPQTRYEYAQRYAWLKNASGGHSQAATPIWVLVRERFCRTTQGSASGCAGGASDEVVTDYDYGPDSGPQNLLLRGVAVSADGQIHRTCYGYDSMGRKISETKPRAALAACP